MITPVSISPPAATDQRDVVAKATIAAGLAASVVYALLSTGGYQLDDLTHFLIAKWAWRHPSFLLFDWGRPGFTIAYFLPSALGWTAARLTTTIICSATAWLAYRVARRMSIPFAWLVPLLLYTQPLFFELSFVTLTETALAFYLIAAVALAQANHWSLSAAVLSLTLLTRHEAVVFVPVWLAVAWWRGVPLWQLWPMAWAIIVHRVLTPFPSPGPFWQRWLDARPTAYYGHGGWLSMSCRSLEAWGPGVAVLAICGLPATRRRPIGGLVVGSLLAYFFVHTLFWALGLYGTGGFPRFLVGVSPLAAIAAAQAVSMLFSYHAPTPRHTMTVAAAVAAAFVVAVERQMRLPGVPFYLPYSHHAQWLMRVLAAAVSICALAAWARPRTIRRLRATAKIVLLALCISQALAWQQIVTVLNPLPNQLAADNALRWLREHQLADRPLTYADVCLAYARNEPFAPETPALKPRAREAPIGSLIAWDPFFSEHALPGPALTQTELDSSPAFRFLYETPSIPGQPDVRIRIYEKLAPGPP